MSVPETDPAGQFRRRYGLEFLVTTEPAPAAGCGQHPGAHESAVGAHVIPGGWAQVIPQGVVLW